MRSATRRKEKAKEEEKEKDKEEEEEEEEEHKHPSTPGTNSKSKKRKREVPVEVVPGRTKQEQKEIVESLRHAWHSLEEEWNGWAGSCQVLTWLTNFLAILAILVRPMLGVVGPGRSALRP